MSGPVLTLNNGREIPVSEAFVADAIQQAANADDTEGWENRNSDNPTSKVNQAQEDPPVPNDTDAEPEQQADDEDDSLAVENSRRLDTMEQNLAEIRNHIVDGDQADDEPPNEDKDEEGESMVDEDQGEDDPDAREAAAMLAQEYDGVDVADVFDALNALTPETQADTDEDDDEDDEEGEREEQASPSSENQDGESVKQAETPTPSTPGTQHATTPPETRDTIEPAPGVPAEAYDLGPNDTNDLEKVVQAGAMGEQWATEELLRRAIDPHGGA